MAYFHYSLSQLEVPLLSARQAKMNGACYQTRPDSTTTVRSAVFIEESDGNSGQEFIYRDELLNRIYKFLGVIEMTLQDLQIQGFIILKKPSEDVILSLLSGMMVTKQVAKHPIKNCYCGLYYDCAVVAKQ